ncbi:MAG TPA: hypothetical protein VFH73_10685 [Polyangia bacterium]|jgi:hypothetical protein|nr:hypothetical protein [Polyangia bacterium]
MSDLANKGTPTGQVPDDEFANVPSARTRHPVIAVAAALLAFFIVYYKRGDLAYSLTAGEPRDLGQARTLFLTPERVAAFDNRTVRIAGVPDRENALELDTKGSWTFTQFFRVLGTGGRLFVHRLQNPLPAYRAEHDVFEGRLLKISDLSFHGAIRRYYATHVSATHFFAPEEFARVIAASPAGQLVVLRDVAGDEVRLSPADLVAIDVRRPDEVVVGLPRDKFHDEAAARIEIEKHGGAVTGPAEPAVANGPPAERYTFVARFPPERRQQALGALGDLDRRVEIRENRQSHKARLSDLTATADRLAIPGQPAIATASISAVKTLAAVQIPDDAYLLIEGELPRDHFHTVIASALLMLFGVVNLIGLHQGLRR